MEKIRTLEEVEKEHILNTLRILKGDRLRTAILLGIGKTTIYRKLNRWGIDSNFDFDNSK